MIDKKTQMSGAADGAIRDKLAIYNSFNDREHSASESGRKAYAELQELIKPERRKFVASVKAVMKSARKEWTLDKAELSVIVQHGQRPLQYFIDASVDLFFYDDWRRGHMHLSASHDKIDLLLNELRVCVSKKGGDK